RPKPVVRVHPDENVFREEKVTLTCHIQETGYRWYNWYKDEKHVNSAERDQNYIITSVDRSHDGVYSCRGSQNSYHSEFSDGVKLTVS
ncbi:hypothetical protein M9458_052726, partial [Cirrhinus mrigala]